MHYIRFFSLLFFWAGLTFGLYGQNSKFLSIQYVQEKIGFAPFVAYHPGPSYSGATLSYEVTTRQNKVYRYSHVIQLGYYHHQPVHQLGYLALKGKLEWRLGKWLDMHFMPGLGYARSMTTQPVYTLQDGQYQEAAHRTKGHFMPSVGLGLGVHVEGIGVFVRQEYALLYPNTRRLPLSVNALLGIGLQISLTNPTNFK